MQADTFLPSSDIACEQGELLGKALVQSSLQIGYNGHGHFIGHSMGTIVNATACDYVHGAFPRASMNPAIHWQSAQTTPHMTLLDEAGIAPKLGISVNPASSLMWDFARKGLVGLAPVRVNVS